MELVFTKDMGTNFKAGDICDYPVTTWRQIAKNAGRPLESFTAQIEKTAAAKGKRK